MLNSQPYSTSVILALSLMALAATQRTRAAEEVWAINVGGPACSSVDGVRLDSEISVAGGTLGTLDGVKGSEGPALYRTCREGDLRIARPLDVGQYDITFYFA